MGTMPPWIAAFVALPGVMFVYWGFRAAGDLFSMVDQINAVVAPKDQVLYYGIGPIMAWRMYERLFPNRTDLPRSFRRYATRSLLAFSVTIGLTMLLTAFIR